MKKVFVLGGDGFCGWPTSLHLSNLGHEIIIIDNLARRKIDIDLQTESLTPITSISTRISAWQKLSSQKIDFYNIDIAADYQSFFSLLCELRPDAIVHFAEQRSAPYSMLTEQTKRYTVNNNLIATHNVLCAIVESGLNIHLLHLGSIGVYGYKTASIEIPEGYLSVTLNSQSGQALEQEILYPANPDSIYHMTKSQDQLFFHFYNKNNGLRITDLHQGIVWGTQTSETKQDERLINRFDYDGIYGTVLNRFLVQATVGYPLTVYGTGGQTRAFIHIQDTVRCIELALSQPPDGGDRVQIFNQITQTHSINNLAKIIADLMGAEIQYLPNPRFEPEANEFVVSNRCFLSMGLNPIVLESGLLEEVQEIVYRYKDRCDLSKIPATSHWRK
ncbi:NAD-dependent epimerase/dehydratase family protein [Sphaerothrix gracilis]|uniref:NAD-dependent epimerase/dehydratase family protein n=1 Tax=Sphaerothrix gracilis TaxID=3151835 RepID=UPI0031FD751A